MYKSTHLGEVMETTCNQCNSRFRLSESQLKQAYGKVRCSECGCVFNALIGLKNYEGKLPPDYLQRQRAAAVEAISEQIGIDEPEDSISPPAAPALSLHQAMYGDEKPRWFSLGPLGWLVGILLLAAAGIAQAVYYQRYELIEDPRYQRQVLTLCRILPCSMSRFASIDQIQLLERNVFTHPIAENALMVTGSFSNHAPFPQRMPEILISLFDVQGRLIANRMFKPAEYLAQRQQRILLAADETVQFRLELVDPGTEALTYEFEFF